jgi:hypothetical protein
LRKTFAGQVRVQTAQPAKAIGAHSHALQIRKHNAASIPDDYVFYIAVAIHENSNLSANLVRSLRKLARKLLSDDLAWRDSPRVKLFEAMDLVRLESL